MLNIEHVESTFLRAVAEVALIIIPLAFVENSNPGTLVLSIFAENVEGARAKKDGVRYSMDALSKFRARIVSVRWLFTGAIIHSIRW